MLYLLHYSVIDFFVSTTVITDVSIKFYLGIIISAIISYIFYYIFGEKNILGRFFELIFIQSNNLLTKGWKRFLLQKSTKKPHF